MSPEMSHSLQRGATRNGATVLAVLIILSIVCLLAHQTVRTMVLLRRGQDNATRIAQAYEVLELGRDIERRFRSQTERLTSGPFVVKLSQEFAKLDFVTEEFKPAGPGHEQESSDTSNDSRNEASPTDANQETSNKPIIRITATWPVDSQGVELPNRFPIVVSWEKFPQ